MFVPHSICYQSVQCGPLLSARHRRYEVCDLSMSTTLTIVPHLPGIFFGHTHRDELTVSLLSHVTYGIVV